MNIFLKKGNILFCLLLVTLILLLFILEPTWAETDPEGILKYVFERQGFLNGSFRIDINATSMNKKEVNRAVVRIYVDSKEKKQIIIFTAPEKLKGSSYLVIGYNTWIYEKGLKRPLRISAQQKLFGDAGIAETAGIDYVNNYEIIKMVENNSTLEFDLKALDQRTAYQQAKIWISQDELKLNKINLMTMNGKPLKELRYFDFHLVNGHELASIEIRNLLYEKDRTTILQFVDVEDCIVPAEAYNPLMMDKYPILLDF